MWSRGGWCRGNVRNETGSSFEKPKPGFVALAYFLVAVNGWPLTVPRMVLPSTVPV